MNPGHDTGSFNYHLKILTKSDMVSTQNGNYWITQKGKRISQGLLMEDGNFEVLRMEPILDETQVEVKIEEREKEGMEIPKPTWQGVDPFPP